MAEAALRPVLVPPSVLTPILIAPPAGEQRLRQRILHQSVITRTDGIDLFSVAG